MDQDGRRSNGNDSQDKKEKTGVFLAAEIGQKLFPHRTSHPSDIFMGPCL
jgi:hypothetical protein